MWQKKFLILLTRISLIFAIFLTLSFLLWQKNPISTSLRLLSSIGMGITSSVYSTLQFTTNFLVKIDTYRALQSRYAAAQKQIELYELEKDKFELLKSENKKLRELIKLPSISSFPEVKAEVIGIQINSISPQLTINQGTANGIKPFMPVFTRCLDLNEALIRCVVGIVASVRKNTSIVHPIIHSAFQMGVRLQATDSWGIVSGNTNRVGELMLAYNTSNLNTDVLILEREKIKKELLNTYVYSSGGGGIFPKGIPVGYIYKLAKIDQRNMIGYVKSFTNFLDLNHVIVIKKPVEDWKNISVNKEDFYQFILSYYKPPAYPEELIIKRPVYKKRSSKVKKIEPAREIRKIQNIPEN